MRRRDFIAGPGAVAVPPTAIAQQSDRTPQESTQRRVAILLAGPQDSPDAKAQLGAFQRTLEGLGWADGKTVRFDVRSAFGDRQRMNAAAQELIQLRP